MTPVKPWNTHAAVRYYNSETTKVGQEILNGVWQVDGNLATFACLVSQLTSKPFQLFLSTRQFFILAFSTPHDAEGDTFLQCNLPDIAQVAVPGCLVALSKTKTSDERVSVGLVSVAIEGRFIWMSDFGWLGLIVEDKRERVWVRRKEDGDDEENGDEPDEDKRENVQFNVHFDGNPRLFLVFGEMRSSWERKVGRCTRELNLKPVHVSTQIQANAK
jgi:hypothetical protein